MENDFAVKGRDFQEAFDLFKAYVSQCNKSGSYNSDILKHFSNNMEEKKEAIIVTFSDGMNNGDSSE